MHGWLRVAVAGGVLTGGILFLQFFSRGEAVPLRRPLQEFALEVGAYRGAEEGMEPEIIKALGVTDFMMRHYAAPARLPVWLYVGYYESQRKGVIIHSPRQCLPGSGWSIVKSERVGIDVASTAAPAIVVNRVLVAKGSDRQLVLYWYQERGRVVASEYWGKAYMVWDSITRTRTDGALVRLSTPVVTTEGDAYERVAEFAARIFPLLTDFLPG